MLNVFDNMSKTPKRQVFPENNLPRIELFQSQKSFTPQPHSRINRIAQEIESLTGEIARISEENASLRSTQLKLQNDLDKMTKALSGVLDTSTKYNRERQAENEALSHEIEEQNQILQKIKINILQLIEKGVDVFKIPEIDIRTLAKLCGLDLTKLCVDEIAQKVINSNSYFKDCESNDDFISKCINLQRELNERKSSEQRTAKRLDSLRVQLRKLQDQNSISSAKISREIKGLIQERDKLREKISKHKKTKQNSSC